MPDWLRVLMFALALCCFLYEVWRARSVLAGGLAFFTVPFLWDAIDAANDSG
jgi:hypothetical protein